MIVKLRQVAPTLEWNEEAGVSLNLELDQVVEISHLI